MTTPKRPDELIPIALDDPTLVLMAQKGYQPAWQALLDRYSQKVQQQVTRLARKAHGRGTVLEDLQQNAIVWLEEAIQRYKPQQLAKAAGLRFASFVWRVIDDRFRNEHKRLRRREKHHDRSPKAARALDTAANEQRWHGRPAPPSSDDPALAAEQHELQECLQAVTAQLNERERQLLEAMEANHLAAFARQQGVTLSTVRRWRARLRKKLRVPLHAWLKE